MDKRIIPISAAKLQYKLNSLTNNNYNNCEVYDFEEDSSIDSKTSYGKNGEKLYSYTVDGRMEKGVHYTGEAGSEKVAGRWEIEYVDDSRQKYKTQKQFDANGNLTSKTGYGENGEKTYSYTVEDRIEKGVNYTGEAGNEKVSGRWEIEYGQDGSHYKTQKQFDANGNLIYNK